MIERECVDWTLIKILDGFDMFVVVCIDHNFGNKLITIKLANFLINIKLNTLHFHHQFNSFSHTIMQTIKS